MARPTRTSLGHALGTRPAGSPVGSLLTGARTIMAIGDSITRGWLPDSTTSGGWRVDIASRISDAGLPWSFIGPYTDTGAHAGVNGRPIGDVATAIPTLIGPGYYRPDVIVLMCGTNDSINYPVGYSGATSQAAFASVLAAIETAEPAVRLVVVSELPTTVGAWAAYAGQVADLNGRIVTELDASAIHAAGRMVRVPIGRYLRGAHVAGDGIHPTQAAYGLMASALWPAICNAMGASAEW